MKEAHQLRILYVGTFPPPEGGVRIGVKLLATELAKDPGVTLHTIDISTRLPGVRRIPVYISRSLQILTRAPFADIIAFSAPVNYTLLFGAFVFLVSRMWRRPLIFRHSAGHNIHLYETMSPLKQWMMRRTVFLAELNLYQTAYQAEYFRRLCAGRVLVFPNHRPGPKLEPHPRPSTPTRFVFVGKIERTKGIVQLVEVFKTLPNELTLDIYGEPYLDITGMIEDAPGIVYKGVISNRSIVPTLQQYDALILPSIDFGEGHPGVIVESFLAGIPVIATDLPGILEIVEHETTGIVVEHGNHRQLRDSILKLSSDTDLYRSLLANVARQKQRFRSDRWARVYSEWCKELVTRDSRPSDRVAAGDP